MYKWHLQEDNDVGTMGPKAKDFSVARYSATSIVYCAITDFVFKVI
jgi:hypothetical protein